MTVTSTARKTSWNGDGATVLFSVTFKLFATSDLQVYVDDVLQTEVTHYTVVLSGDPAGDDGADVTFVTAPPSGTSNVDIVRVIPMTQGVALPLAGKFPSTSVEEAFDRAIALLQDRAEDIDRAVKLAITSSLSGLTLPEGALKSFRWNSGMDDLELYDPLDSGLYSDPVTTRGDLIRGSSLGAQERLAIGLTKKYLKSDGTDAAWAYITALQESGGPTVLDIGAITDGQILKRSGASIVSEMIQPIDQSFRGLSVGTSGNNSIAAKAVSLFSAKEIALDNGMTLTDWEDLSADITAAGAGGLDTGAEAASTWYEIYAIGKADGTKAIMLHRAMDYQLDQSQAANNASLSLKSGAADHYRAQSFDVDVTGKLSHIDLVTVQQAAPSGSIYIEIREDNADSPTNAGVLATSDKHKIDDMQTSAASWIRYPFRSPPTLTAGTKYWIVVTGDWTPNAVNYGKIQYQNTDVYAAGKNMAGDDAEPTGWTTSPATSDMTFNAFIEGNDTSVTMPAEYTGKCLIGYVYNGAGSDFLRFYQIERDVIYSPLAATITAGTTSTVPLLADIRALVPQVPVSVYLQGGNTNAGAYNNFGGVPYGYDVVGMPLHRHYFHVAANTNLRRIGHVPTEKGGIYVSVSAGTGGFWIGGYTW